MNAKQGYKFHRTARYLLAVPMVFLLDWWVAALIGSVLQVGGGLISAGFADRRHAKCSDFSGNICDFGLRAVLVFVQKV